MSVLFNWGRCPQRRVKGWVLAILAMLALRLCVAPGCSAPGFAAFDTLPPGLRQSGRVAGRFAPATCTDHLRLNGEGRIWYAFW